MFATALSASLLGLEARLVRVEVEIARGVPSFELVGLAEAAVRESRVRVKSALAHEAVDLSEYHVTVSLAPADEKKTGSGFDLAIALATLAAVGRISEDAIAGVLLVGELSLSGMIHPLRGILPQLLGARSHGITRAIVPRANGFEASLARGVSVKTAASLSEILQAISGGKSLPKAERPPAPPSDLTFHDDLADVRGQPLARRALEIAAAGGHNVLMVGPPGAGKTMLARRLPGILPPLDDDERLEVTAIHSIAGLLPSASSGAAIARRPFRAPHHTVSEAGLVGGGSDAPRPGEVSLAHHGVLFLDELPEFRRSSLEALRQPLEDGVIAISRAHGKVVYPARPVLVSAMNPCPCGYHGDGSDRCLCTRERIRQYRARVSGPLLDRIDVHVALPPVDPVALTEGGRGEATSAVRARVLAAREVQSARKRRGETAVATNGALGTRELERIATPTEAGKRLIAKAIEQLGLSARAFGKVLRVARTIADLDRSSTVEVRHVAEAIGARLFDRTAAAAA